MKYQINRRADGTKRGFEVARKEKLRFFFKYEKLDKYSS